MFQNFFKSVVARENIIYAANMEKKRKKESQKRKRKAQGIMYNTSTLERGFSLSFLQKTSQFLA